jgi:two-component system response regulator RegA
MVEAAGMAEEKHLLLIDDNELFLRTLGRALEAEGVVVYEANSFAAAVVQIRHMPKISLAVIDLHLDQESGLDVVRGLRASRKDLRCVVLSSFCSSAAAVDAMRAGALDCLSKTTAVPDIIKALWRDPSTIDALDLPFPTLAQVEWEHIQRTLHDCSGNISQAARKLGMPRQTLQRKLQKYAPAK